MKKFVVFLAFVTAILAGYVEWAYRAPKSFAETFYGVSEAEVSKYDESWGYDVLASPCKDVRSVEIRKLTEGGFEILVNGVTEEIWFLEDASASEWYTTIVVDDVTSAKRELREAGLIF